MNHVGKILRILPADSGPERGSCCTMPAGYYFVLRRGPTSKAGKRKRDREDCRTFGPFAALSTAKMVRTSAMALGLCASEPTQPVAMPVTAKPPARVRERAMLEWAGVTRLASSAFLAREVRGRAFTASPAI